MKDRSLLCLIESTGIFIKSQSKGRSIDKDKTIRPKLTQLQTKEAGEAAKRGRNDQSGRKKIKQVLREERKTLGIDRATEKPPQTQSA
jgi:hypothetical protein